MRTTDFCFPLPDYEYPCLVSYRHLFEAYASPLANGLAPMDQETGGPGVSRRRIRFGRLLRVGARRNSSGAPVGAVPLAPLSLPGILLRAFAWGTLPSCQDRFLRLSVKMKRTLRPKGPSIVRGHPRSCVDRCRSRSRSRAASVMIRPSVPFHLRLRGHRFREHPKLPVA